MSNTSKLFSSEIIDCFEVVKGVFFNFNILGKLIIFPFFLFLALILSIVFCFIWLMYTIGGCIVDCFNFFYDNAMPSKYSLEKLKKFSFKLYSKLFLKAQR